MQKKLRLLFVLLVLAGASFACNATKTGGNTTDNGWSNSYNNFTAQPNEDGSYTIHFGGCDDGRINCLPITPGWNHTIRMYQPRAEVLDGSWHFPAPQPVG